MTAKLYIYWCPVCNRQTESPHGMHKGWEQIEVVPIKVAGDLVARRDARIKQMNQQIRTANEELRAADVALGEASRCLQTLPRSARTPRRRQIAGDVSFAHNRLRRYRLGLIRDIVERRAEPEPLDECEVARRTVADQPEPAQPWA